MYHFFTETRLITFTVSSISLLVFSIILMFVIIPPVIESQIDMNIRLERGTEQWHRFVQIPFNMTFNVTFFQVDNAEDVVKYGAQPNLTEKGPYVFDKMMRRSVSFYNETNQTSTYDREFEFHLNPTLSGPNLSYDDNITIINPAYLAILQLAPQEWITDRSLLSCMRRMFPNGLVMKDFPIRRLVFEGYPICNFTIPACMLVCPLFHLLADSKLMETLTDENNKQYINFAYFKYRTKTDGIFEVNTGMSEIKEIGKIKSWNYSNYTTVWNKVNKTSCDYVSGTDGTLFSPHLTQDSVINVYSTDVCRSVQLYYNGTDTYNGIEGLVYKTKPTLFESKTPTCFCGTTLTPEGEKSCFMDGVMDLSPCFGAPILASYPHFLYADKYLANYTGSLSPDPEKHEIRALLDKYTGVPLQAHQRVQISIVLRNVKNFEKVVKALPHTLLPLAWIDEGINLPSSGIDLLNSLLYNTLKLVKILELVFVVSCLIATIGSFVLLYYHLY